MGRPATIPLALLALSLAWGCGGKSKDEDDTGTDTADDTATDETTDTTDVPPDTAPDTGDDPVEDTAGDPDVVEDTADDPVEDTSLDPVDDEVTDVADDDASDVADDDTTSDASDVTSETTCTGTPYIRMSDKGIEYTSGACNPDGSTTEILVAADLGSCCISVDHYCAWMNCCTTLSPTIGITTMPSTVTITENQTGTFCRCEGWFSPGYEICGLAPGSWTVRIGTLFTTVTVT